MDQLLKKLDELFQYYYENEEQCIEWETLDTIVAQLKNIRDGIAK